MSNFLNHQAKTNPPASEALLANARTEFGDRLPNTLFTLWQESDGVSFPESGVVLYATSDIAERNSTYEVAEYAPNLILVGDDSGGNGFFTHAGAKSVEIIKIDLGAIGSSDGTTVAADLLSWVAQGCPLLVAPHADQHTTNEKFDIILESIPKDGLKGMLLIKKKLALALSATQLKELIEQLPVILLKRIYYTKYKSLFEEINKTQHCLRMERSE